MSASTCPQNGPAITWQSSITRTPSRALTPGHPGARVRAPQAILAATRAARRASPLTLQKLQRRADPVADVVARDPQPHLHAGQRAGEHQVVEVAEMADPEHLVLELAEPRAERHVEALEDHAPDLVGAVEHDRGQRAGELALVGREHLQPPAATAARVAAACRAWRAKTFERPSSRSIATPRAARRGGWWRSCTASSPPRWPRRSAPSPSRSAASARRATPPAPSRTPR